MSDPDLLTYTQAAELIGCSKRTLYRIIAEGALQPVREDEPRRPRRDPRIRRADALALGGVA